MKEGVKMKHLLFFILLTVMVLAVTNCERRGSISDIAKIQQAERAIKHIRLALEEYYIENNTYPPQGVDLKEALLPYVPKTKVQEGDSVSKWITEIEPAFSEGPFYTTQDPKINYFVKAKANDINRTPVSIRPSTIREKEEEEENDKKKGK